MNRTSGTRQASLKNGPGQRHAVLALAGGLRKKLIDVGRDGLVEIKLLTAQLEGYSVDEAVGKEPIPFHVAQVFLEPPERPWAIRPQTKNLPADDLDGFLPHLMWFREEIRIDQADEMAEAILIPVMRGGGQQ